MKPERFAEIRPSLPTQPGVYRYYDKDDKILYVGKAKNLKKRISSYFVRKRSDGARIVMLVRQIEKIEYTIVDHEKDALLLENSLIKEFQPKYNIQLKDDKSYPFICIKKERFPRVYVMRNRENDGSEYLGPYTSVKRVRSTLQLITEIFPIRTCKLNLSEKNIAENKFNVCLEYHIGNCMGPCEALQSEEDYNASIQQIRNVLKGKIGNVLQDLRKEMQSFSDHYQFEKAALVKKKIELLKSYQGKSTVVNPKLTDIHVYGYVELEKIVFVNYLKVINGTITQTRSIELKAGLEESTEELVLAAVKENMLDIKDDFITEIILPFDLSDEFPDYTITVPKIGDKKKLLELATKNAMFLKKQRIDLRERSSTLSRSERVLNQLKEDLRLTSVPFHIECFDNSNIQGAHPVASMVVFKNAKPSKKDYRKYNIKTVEGSNDFASMEEVVYRRYRRLLDEQADLPQLIVIDGGKGQLNAARMSLDKLGLTGDIAIIGIAKRLEEIYFPDDSIPLYIDKRSESLKVIQQIRNEAHRFAITFHRQKRSKTLSGTELTNVEGIGQKLADKLLKHFGSVAKIKSASQNELVEVLGPKKAKSLTDYFKSHKE